MPEVLWKEQERSVGMYFTSSSPLQFPFVFLFPIFVSFYYPIFPIFARACRLIFLCRKMEQEQAAARKVFPVRPVPSIRPRDPAVDAPDYILVSKSRLDDLIDFLIKNKAPFLFSFPVALYSLLAPPSPFAVYIFSLFSLFSYFLLFSCRL